MTRVDGILGFLMVGLDGDDDCCPEETWRRLQPTLCLAGECLGLMLNMIVDLWVYYGEGWVGGCLIKSIIVYLSYLMG